MKDCYAVRMEILKDSTKREALKMLALETLKEGKHFIPFATYLDYNEERDEWHEGQIALPVEYYSEVLEWPKEKQIKYAGALLVGYSSETDVIYFNSIDALLNLIEIFENLQKPKSIWARIRSAFQK